MEFQKATPKWFLKLYAFLISLLGILLIINLAENSMRSAFLAWYTFLFILFNIAVLIYFLGNKYEMRSWAVPMAYLVFGFVTTSLIKSMNNYGSYDIIYFLNFIKVIFFLFFVLLVDTLYLHPHIKLKPIAKEIEKVAEEVEEEIKQDFGFEAKPKKQAAPRKKAVKKKK